MQNSLKALCTDSPRVQKLAGHRTVVARASARASARVWLRHWSFSQSINLQKLGYMEKQDTDSGRGRGRGQKFFVSRELWAWL